MKYTEGKKTSINQLHGWVMEQLPNIYVYLEGREKKMFEEMAVDNFPRLVETVSLPIQEVKWTPGGRNMKKITLWYKIKRLLNQFRYRGKSLKQLREKGTCVYKRVILGFPLEALQAREQRNTKYWKGKQNQMTHLGGAL